MASYGLEALNEPLEEAASQLSLDSLRDYFSRVRCICQEFICLTTNSLWKIDDVSACSFSLAYRRHYLQNNDYSKVLLQLYINMCHTKDLSMNLLGCGKRTSHRWL